MPASFTNEVGECLYAVTARKPSAISHAVRVSLTSVHNKNLLVAKFNFLTLFAITEDGLVQLEELNLYAAVINLVAIRAPPNSQGIKVPDLSLIHI